MRSAVRLAAAVLLVGAASVPPAGAWSPRTRMRIADESIRLMPASLRLALERFREDVRRGALEPMTEEGSAAHRPPDAGGSLDASIERAAGELVAVVERGGPFREIARAFGRLSHFVADAGFPPIASGSTDEARFAHFKAFCESRAERFPVVFYGHDDADLAAGDFGGFGREVIRRSAGDDARLEAAYRAAGTPPRPAAFDDRSVPFAVASLSYSHTVTDIARAWLAAWGRAHGDLGRTPYLETDVRERLERSP